MKIRAIVLATLIVVLASCAPKSTEATSALTRDQATAMATHALTEGFNGGSYDAWSRDWTPAMRAAIDEEAFLAFRARAIERYGEFRAIREAKLVPGTQPGFVRWEFLCEFDRQDVTLRYGFKPDGVKIEGAFMEAAEPQG